MVRALSVVYDAEHVKVIECAWVKVPGVMNEAASVAVAELGILHLDHTSCSCAQFPNFSTSCLNYLMASM